MDGRVYKAKLATAGPSHTTRYVNRSIGCHYMPVYIVAAAVVDDADRVLTPSRQPATTIAIEVVATGEAAGPGRHPKKKEERKKR